MHRCPLPWQQASEPHMCSLPVCLPLSAQRNQAATSEAITRCTCPSTGLPRVFWPHRAGQADVPCGVHPHGAARGALRQLPQLEAAAGAREYIVPTVSLLGHQSHLSKSKGHPVCHMSVRDTCQPGKPCRSAVSRRTSSTSWRCAPRSRSSGCAPSWASANPRRSAHTPTRRSPCTASTACAS